MWPLYICDDGCLVYYRDKKEKPGELSDEMKKEIEAKENTRFEIFFYYLGTSSFKQIVSKCGFVSFEGVFTNYLRVVSR